LGPRAIYGPRAALTRPTLKKMKFPVKFPVSRAKAQIPLGKPAVEIDTEEIDENGFAVPTVYERHVLYDYQRSH
jgi:hypothetical protein